MPDKVKQAIFNILGNRYDVPGTLPPLRVADVFAGSGSMGLEALSRGCSSCTFYESDRVALASLRENVASLRAQGQSQIKSGDAWRKAATDAQAGLFDLIFLDPPYRDSKESDVNGPVGRFLTRLTEPGVGVPNLLPLVVLHHSGRVSFLQIDVPGPWVVWDERQMGSSGVTFFMDRADMEHAPHHDGHDQEP